MLAMNHSMLVMKLKVDEKTDVGEEASTERENEMARLFTYLESAVAASSCVTDMSW